MKIKASIEMHQSFNCKICGKHFEGEVNKTDNAFFRHLMIKHPIKSIKNYRRSKHER